MINKKILSLAAGLCCFSVFSHAASVPKSAGYDGRVQQIVYNPADVTVVRVKSGAVSLIQLESDEYLIGDDVGMGLGDPLAWNVAVKGSNIFLRPVAEQPDTNIAIVTNKRTYSVLLSPTDKNPTFILRYIYPKAPEPVKPVVFTGKSKVKFPCSEGNFINGHYEVKGSKSIKPAAIWDNGRHTCFKWDSSSDLPVAFRILPDGKEQLVNYHMEKNVMVIHEVSPDFVLRLGNAVLQVRTQHNLKRSYNEKGTTTGDIRVEK